MWLYISVKTLHVSVFYIVTIFNYLYQNVAWYCNHERIKFCSNTMSSYNTELWDFKLWNIGQNVHTNMGGFRRGSHNYIGDCYKICQTAKLRWPPIIQSVYCTVCTSNVSASNAFQSGTTYHRCGKIRFTGLCAKCSSFQPTGHGNTFILPWLKVFVIKERQLYSQKTFMVLLNLVAILSCESLLLSTNILMIPTILIILYSQLTIEPSHILRGSTQCFW